MSALVLFNSTQKKNQKTKNLGLDINHSQNSNHFILIAASDVNFPENKNLITD